MRRVVAALILLTATIAQADEAPSLADRAIAFMASRPGGNHRVRREERWFRELATIVESETASDRPPSDRR